MNATVYKRADVLLVDKQLALSRTRAQRLIADGCVEVCEAGAWRQLDKPSEKLADAAELRVNTGPEQAYVSRGGLKLKGALEKFNINVSNVTALDIGQSTGGFTDCLLQLGVAKVVGIDVGRNQLAPELQAHPQVVCLEGINARNLPEDELLRHAPDGFDLLVMDVSFISQTLILPNLPRLLAPGGTLVSLVKPQFEVGKAGIGKGGIVRNTALYADVEAKLRNACSNAGFNVVGYTDSPITGTDGNREFFICAIRPDGEKRQL